MKKLLLLLLPVTILTGCSALSNINWDSEKLSSAAGKAMTAASITDDQIVELCRQSIAQLDAQNTIENGPYLKRLKKIMSGVQVPGLNLNFAVYKVNEVNAFASGDGSVRVYTGIMDLMTDDELVAIIGHEIGHVVHKDSKNAMKKAYLTAAAVDAVGAAGSVGAVTQAMLGNITQSYLNAQFSQKQEFKADEYGFEFSVQNGRNPYSMANALSKLVKEGSAPASKLSQRFASHPDSALRAQKMRAKADAYEYEKSQTQIKTQ